MWHANRIQQFSYNSVIKFGSVNAIDVDSIRIRCASGKCEFNSHSNRIKCEKAFRFDYFQGLNLDTDALVHKGDNDSPGG